MPQKMGTRPKIFTQCKHRGIIHMLFRCYTKREFLISGMQCIALWFFNNKSKALVRRSWKLLGCEFVCAELDVFSLKADGKSDHYYNYYKKIISACKRTKFINNRLDIATVADSFFLTNKGGIQLPMDLNSVSFFSKFSFSSKNQIQNDLFSFFLDKNINDPFYSKIIKSVTRVQLFYLPVQEIFSFLMINIFRLIDCNEQVSSLLLPRGDFEHQLNLGCI